MFPAYRLLVVGIALALVVGHAAMYGPQASFFSELFGTKVRYSGASLGYQFASVIAGGLSPLIATGLLKRYNASWPIALYIIVLATVTTISVFFATETVHTDIGAAISSRAEQEAGAQHALAEK